MVSQRIFWLFGILCFVMVTGFSEGILAQSAQKKCPKSQSAYYHNCIGTYTYSNGNKYVGEFRNDKRNGLGTFTFANGSKYVGEFRDDKINGHGTFTFSNGNKYVGEFRNEKINGLGRFTYADGDMYVGEFRDDKINGQGTFKFANGNKYVGEFRNDKINGQGTYTFANGNKYVGEFRNEKRNGQGTYTFADGGEYVGEFRDDKINGHGTVTYASGNKYVGEFRNEKRNGHGTFTFANGDKYVGGFKDGDYEGRGVLYAANGTIKQQGIYKNDNFVKSVQIVEPQEVAKVELPQQVVLPAAANDNQRKVALVIGNEAYKHTTRLKNPKNDARAMSAMLKRLGFEVVFGTDLNKRSLEETVRKFVTKLRRADVSLFFYAGHGLQVSGRNYLIPIDAAVKDETALDFELVKVSVISNYMGGNGNVGVILLDACRDNPLTRSMAANLGTRSSQVGRGLARIPSIGGGLLVGFATAPGDVAADGTGKNSPFTTALLKHLPTPGLEIQRLMTRVKAEVASMTNNHQRPWHNSDLTKEVVLFPGR